MTNKKEMKSGLVSHDSFLHEDCLFIHGGSTGGDFNKEFMIFSKGEMKYMEGHNSVGGICFVNDKCIFVIGGVSGPMNINGIIAYP